jgi:SSS family solute:Na+ symporter
MIAVALTQRTGSNFAIPAKPDGTPNFDLVIQMMLSHYFPNGLLGLGLTALIASFMSGMAGNITAFNTVWTNDIYRALIRVSASDEHYLSVGRLATVIGVLLSLVIAYEVAQFNNIMDVLQLVFAFINAPLFATFLLGMFWKRANGHGAFAGLVAGTLTAALHQGLTLPSHATIGIKGGWLSLAHSYPSEMAQNFWTAIFAWTACFLVTIGVSLATAPPREDLKGLVYSETPREVQACEPWYRQPVVLGILALGAVIALNIVFW